MNSSTKTITAKGWLINNGLNLPERKKIKIYLSKKHALQAKSIKQGIPKSKILPCLVTYKLPITNKSKKKRPNHN